MAISPVPILITLALFGYYGWQNEPTNASLHAAAFAEFNLAHNRTHATEEEFTLRFEAFKTNLEFINERNSQGLTYTLAVNKFADWTDEELTFSSIEVPESSKLQSRQEAGFGVNPNSVDWTQYGAVTGIKDEVNCQVSSVFAMVASIESQSFIQGNTLTSFSEQMAIDCIPSSQCTENPTNAIGDIIDYFNSTEPFVTYEAAYPYTAQKQTCEDSGLPVIYQTGGFEAVTPNSEASMEQAILDGPIVASLIAEKDFIFYDSGIWDPPSCTDNPNLINHSVLVVGYLEQDFGNTTTWKVKNNWGNDWGEMGYMYVNRVPNSVDGGVCKIQSYPIAPTVRSSS